MKLLFVEDDETIASGLCYALEAEGYEVTRGATVREALAALEMSAFDLALVDLALPDGAGFTVCEAVKARSGAPVVFLTAADDEGNVIRGFDLGADDYIVKPFRLRELLARLKAVMRRAAGGGADIIRVGNIELHALSGKAYKDSKELTLTAMEYRLLLLLMRHAGQLLTRGQLLEDLWDAGGEFVNDNTLSVYIKRLREKLGDVQAAAIQTVRGIGYRMGG